MIYDPTDLKGQDEQRDEESKRKQIAESQTEKDLKWLMSSPQGRRIVWRLLEQAGVFQSSFNTNALTMAHNEGRRSYGNQMLTQIMRDCPELFSPMMKEQNGSDGNGTKSN